ncbi:MAG: hypothetical protein ACFFCV_05000 [Promethearchaeota archaeon]
MKSTLKNKKIAIGCILVVFLLFNIFAISNVLAATMQENAVFDLDKEDPLGPEAYGALIPSPNTIGALYLDGKNQGKFTVTDWLGNLPPLAEEIINYPGEDISLYYPTDLAHYGIGSMSSNDEIDPWNDVSWLNISAYNAEAETLSPFTVSTVFDYFAMEEGGSFSQPFNYDHPMQVDLIVKSRGPKALKVDWITPTPGSISYMYFLSSPSGKIVNCYDAEADFMGVNPLYDYILFSANEIGAYRLIVVVVGYADPATLNMEFLSLDISSLPSGSVRYGGNFDDYGTLDVTKIANWQSQWFKIYGKKGEVFNLEIYEEFSTGFTPTIDIWSPCANGYILANNVGTGAHEIYFAKTDYAYVSLTDIDFGDWYRYTLFLTKASNEKYTLGDTTLFSISMDEAKTIQFTVRKDSIVRFNYTSLPNPTGAPALNSLGSANAYIYRDSKNFVCYDINTAIMTRTVDSTDLRWHYMPAGTYIGVIKNTNPFANGLFKVSSQVYECSDESVPVNDLIYPQTSPTDFVTVDFEPDSVFGGLKDPVGLDIEIPDIGQFRLNTSIWLSDNPGLNTSFSPMYLYLYNSTDSEFYSYGYPQPVFSLDGSSTLNDYLYIGAPNVWTGMTFDFSVPGVGGNMEFDIYDGGWPSLDWESDGTSFLTTDGTVEFDVLGDSGTDFDDWIRGTGGIDIDPNIDENDYFWMRIDCITTSYTTVPVIQELTLLNATLVGDLQYWLIGESGFEYADYWGPSGITQPTDPANLIVGMDADISDFDDWDSTMIRGGDPMTVGFEGGTYKLIIIPELWTTPGSVSVQFAVENYWSYGHHATYDIETLTPDVNLHARDITNFTLSGYSNITGTVYPYGLVTEYNHTESLLPYGGESYFALECIGEPYQWTQLVATVQGLGTGDYDLYILQDLPWIDNTGPNSEFRMIYPTNVDYNYTYEFGVFSSHFTLLFEVSSSLDNVTFYLSLSQYDTIQLTTSDVKASYTPPLSDAAILALAIGIPAAVGAVVVIYVLKKKGKILTKRPS